MSLITIFINGAKYQFKRIGNDILVNDDKIILDFDLFKSPKKQEESAAIYKMLIDENQTDEYARYKASLYFAKYNNVDDSQSMEFMDTIVLYLLGCFRKNSNPLDKLISNMRIIINDNEICVNNTNKYIFDTISSSCINYDYEKLLNVLINDNNALTKKLF